MKSAVTSLPLAVLLLAAACGPTSSGGGGSDGGTGGGLSGFPVAPHAPYPLVVNHGGGVLAHPKVVTISFTGYDHADKLKTFGKDIVSSKWLVAAGQAYGVGSGTFIGNYVFPNQPSVASGTAAASFIEKEIKLNKLPVAKAGTEPYLYMVFYNLGVPIYSGPNGQASCSTFAGFHSEADFSTGRFPIAVLPECGGMLQKWSYIESAASHELIEAATDPFPFSSPGGWYLDDPNDPWSQLGGEVGDLCVSLDVTENGDTYQRTWSNAAAASGHDNPCVPTNAGPQFGISQSDNRIVQATAGDNLSIPLHAWTSAKTTPFHIQVFTWTEDWSGNPTLSTSSVNNGDIAKLNVTVPPSTQHGSKAMYLIIGETSTGLTFWPVEINVP